MHRKRVMMQVKNSRRVDSCPRPEVRFGASRSFGLAQDRLHQVAPANPSPRGRGGLAGRPLQGDDVATSWRVIEGFSVGLVIPDLWQQEAVRALQQGKDVVVQAPTALKSAVTQRCYSGLASRRRASKSRGRVSIAIEPSRLCGHSSFGRSR
jgi:hypothetical protein